MGFFRWVFLGGFFNANPEAWYPLLEPYKKTRHSSSVSFFLPCPWLVLIEFFDGMEAVCCHLKNKKNSLPVLLSIIKRMPCSFENPTITCLIASSIIYVVLRIRIRIRIWIHRIHMFLGLVDQDPLVRGMDPDPDPSIIMQK